MEKEHWTQFFQKVCTPLSVQPTQDSTRPGTACTRRTGCTSLNSKSPTWRWRGPEQPRAQGERKNVGATYGAEMTGLGDT